MKTHAEIRQAYLDFFSDKIRQHVIVPSASLVPENDPTTLFTGSGMQPMIPYLLGEIHPMGRRLTDSQKCFRSQDIEEVGDNRHTTFFEMLGNWSFGDYFKQEQIPWMFEFLTDRLGLDPNNLYVTVFRGNEDMGIPRDTESVELWKTCFASKKIETNDVDFSERDGLQGGRIFYYPENKNWWSRSGTPDRMPVGEPGGPDSEMFWDFDPENTCNLHTSSVWKDRPCHVNCDCGRFVEIGNNVFMEYRKTEQGFEKLAQKNVDFGGGLERMAAALQNDSDVFKTDVLQSIVRKIEGVALDNATYEENNKRSFRIIADHIRAATFIIGDQNGVSPSNVGQGYLVRRLIRRAIREGKRLGIHQAFIADVAHIIIETLGEHYTELVLNRDRIFSELTKEEKKFGKTVEKGMKELEKMIRNAKGGGVTGEQAFLLFSSYGFPWELTEELLCEQGLSVDRAAFEAEFKKHQELSRTASAGAFKGGLADQSAATTRLHTATHLLHRALKTVLGDHVQQKGSNITAERLRFDFSHPQKMTDEELKKAEEIVNDVIKQDLPVRCEELSFEDAKKTGAFGYFEDTYAKMEGKIKVYFVGDDARGYFSKEICGGPHVTRTGELGSFKIQKEEAVSAGVRRIKATVGGS